MFVFLDVSTPTSTSLLKIRATEQRYFTIVSAKLEAKVLNGQIRELEKDKRERRSLIIELGYLVRQLMRGLDPWVDRVRATNSV